MKSCEVCLDPKVKNKAKEWIKPDTWEAVNARHSLKKLTAGKSKRLHDRLRQQYKEVKKKVKRMVQADKCFYADNLAAQAKKAAAKKSSGRFTRPPSWFVASTAIS